jgi:pectate lyase
VRNRLRQSLLLVLAACALRIEFASTAPAAEPAPSPIASPTAAAHEPLAFPGAEGFGRFAKGGRGGDVYHVTNLNDAGPGSLREGVRTAKGPRTIVFDLSGTIELKHRLLVDKSFLTIAGQTALGDGICLKDHTFEIRRASHVIVRYLRVRLGDKNKPPHQGDDAMTTDDIDNVILDHLTVTWGIDSNHDLRRGKNFTLQWSLYAEALNRSLHEKGAHAMLASFRDLTGNISIHHNLFASSRERHPTLASGEKTRPGVIVDFRNNVVYNLSGATNLGDAHINFINNYYRPGPNTPRDNFPLAAKIGSPDKLEVFMTGNTFEGSPAFSRDNYLAITFDRWKTGGYVKTTLEKVRVPQEFDVGEACPQTDPAGVALEKVLQKAGCTHPRRDAADQRIVEGVRKRTNRLIDSQDEVGGWPTLRSFVTSEPAKDTDGDGMPDEWELRHGLNPNDPKDGNAVQSADGYTNLEKYLNAL